MAARSAKAIKYAEDILSVHAVWNEAQERLALHKSALEDRKKLLYRINRLKAEIELAELQFLTNAGTMFPDAKSKTDLQERTKLAIRSDPPLRALNDELGMAQADLSIVDGEVRHHEIGLKTLAARMSELNGLLVFYAESMRSEP